MSLISQIILCYLRESCRITTFWECMSSLYPFNADYECVCMVLPISQWDINLLWFIVQQVCKLSCGAKWWLSVEVFYVRKAFIFFSPKPGEKASLIVQLINCLISTMFPFIEVLGSCGFFRFWGFLKPLSNYDTCMTSMAQFFQKECILHDVSLRVPQIPFALQWFWVVFSPAVNFPTQ